MTLRKLEVFPDEGKKNLHNTGYTLSCGVFLWEFGGHEVEENISTSQRTPNARSFKSIFVCLTTCFNLHTGCLISYEFLFLLHLGTTL